MKKFVDLMSLTSSDKIKLIEELEKTLPIVTTTDVRGQKLNFLTHTKRQLWQALGMEFIEPELLNYLDALPAGSVYYDIGASNGIFSLYAAALGLQVCAFEPEAQNYALLEYNNFLNRSHENWILHTYNLAIGSQHSLGTMYIAKYEAAGHMKILNKAVKVQESESFLPEHTQTILTYDLDSLISKMGLVPPQHLKIDVDGSEFEVLKGAIQTLNSAQLKTIFIEIDDTSAGSKFIYTFLEDYNFILQKKFPVQHYENLYNCIFIKTI